MSEASAKKKNKAKPGTTADPETTASSETMPKQDKGALLPAYLINGDDELKREAVIKRLHARVEKLGDLSFNFEAFNGEVARGADIVTACNTLPFASQRRLVQLNHVEKLKKNDSELLVEYLADPNTTTVLALLSSGLAKNTRLYKAVAKLGKTAVIDCASQKRSELPQMVRSLAVNHGVTFTDGAARRLIEQVGENTVRLDAEVAKLALSCGRGATIGESQVDSLVKRTFLAKPWGFLDAFAARDVKRCIVLLPYLDATPFSLLAMCVQRIRELICARSLEARGTGNLLASTLKKQEWQVKNYRRWAQGFSAEELRKALIRARDAEKLMKSGGDPATTFQDWMLATLR